MPIPESSESSDSSDSFPFPREQPAFIAPDEHQALPEPRREKRRHGVVGLQVNLTSLIDVTFLLLVYFMVATSFASTERIYRMDLPDRTGAGGLDAFELIEEPLRISVMSTGLSPSMYQLTIEGPYPQPPSFEALADYLLRAQVGSAEGDGGAGGGNGGGELFEADHPIIIQPTRSTRWEHAIEAFNAAARARYTNVTFAKPA